MYIIDNYKDFYDYVSHIYGVDKQIILDRRKSTRLNKETILDISIKSDPKWERESFILLEYGYKQKIFKLSNIHYDKRNFEYTYNIEHFHTYSEHINLFDCPISISMCLIRVPFFYRWEKKRRKTPIPTIDDLRHGKEKVIERGAFLEFPILAGTELTKFLDPIEVWSEIQNYISSLENDRDVNLPMTNEEKAETHGFDKYSFRHPIK
jgi:hypothetical protein